MRVNAEIKQLRLWYTTKWPEQIPPSTPIYSKTIVNWVYIRNNCFFLEVQTKQNLYQCSWISRCRVPCIPTVRVRSPTSLSVADQATIKSRLQFWHRRTGAEKHNHAGFRDETNTNGILTNVRVVKNHKSATERSGFSSSNFIVGAKCERAITCNIR